jgi:6-phospho-beta-glucosidase
MLDIANDVARLAPDSWIINYTNPTGIIAEAVIKHSKANIAALCAGGLFARDWAAKALSVSPECVRYDYAGLNHLSFSYNITVNGRLLSEDEFILAAKEVGSVDISVSKKLRALPSPYLQYYYHKSRKLKEALAAKQTRGEEVMVLEKEIFRLFSNPDVKIKPEILKKRGGGGYSEVACTTMEALHNNVDSTIIMNVPNAGVFRFLPDDAVIEVPCIVNSSGIKPITQCAPPKSVSGLIASVKTYESLTVEASVKGCRKTAYLALLSHPLVGEADVAEKVLDRLLEANKEYVSTGVK